MMMDHGPQDATHGYCRTIDNFTYSVGGRISGSDTTGVINPWNGVMPPRLVHQEMVPGGAEQHQDQKGGYDVIKY